LEIILCCHCRSVFFSYVIIENPVVSVAYAIRPHKFGYSPRSVREKLEDKQRFASLFLFVRTMQNAVMLIVKPRFAVAGPAVAGCGLWGPQLQNGVLHLVKIQNPSGKVKFSTVCFPIISIYFRR
jgi:hypothetical protein